MINFIISDSYEYTKLIRAVIDSYMMNYDIEVKYHLFSNINSKFYEDIKKITGFKVYILNTDSKTGEGIHKAKYIRRTLDDWNSLIIIITNHNEMKNEVIGKGLFLFDFITKKNYFERKLKDDIDHIRKFYDNRDNCLTFKADRILRKVDFKNINMIIKEKDSKRCLLKSNHGNYYIPESLNQIEGRLDKRFIKINRSCIINIDDLLEYDLNKNKITMKSGDISYDISRDNRKKISNYFDSYK